MPLTQHSTPATPYTNGPFDNPFCQTIKIEILFNFFLKKTDFYIINIYTCEFGAIQDAYIMRTFDNNVLVAFFNMMNKTNFK